MEKDFQTSFIPKKPMMEGRVTASRPIGLLTIITIFVLFTILLASLGLYLYKNALKKNIVALQQNLELAKNRFEPSKIVQLQVLDKRLKASTEVLSDHIAISPIFQVLQDLTMKTVRYTNFTYEIGTDKNKTITIKLSGQATGYRSIALQSDLFASNKVLIDPVFSNLSLDESGNVLFDLDFSVDPSLVNYKQNILAGGQGEGSNVLISPAPVN